MGRKTKIDKADVINLRKEGKSFAEIAQILNCTDTYAWSVWSRDIRGKSMSQRNPDIYKKQSARQQKLYDRGIYNRIAFYQSKKAVNDDNADLKKWQNRQITFQNLCYSIAWNNYLDEFFPYGCIPDEMMLAFLKSTGWRTTL